MDLERELKHQIRSYVEGTCTLSQLRAWLADHAQAIADARSTELDELDGHVWILISEFDYGHRDEVDVRSAMATLIDASGPRARPLKAR